MRKTVYLDSTIPSYLFDQRDSIRELSDITKSWWSEERGNFNVFISDATIAEVSAGNHPYKEKIMTECLSELEVLPPHERLDEIVGVYIQNHLMPKGATGDAVHLAYASFYKADFLMTWNCNHLANANKKQHIAIINTGLGLFVPEIVTPMELFTETDYDK
jgi:predicted nucleic acid-binding protein